MISHDPIITDSLSSAMCKSALLKLFGFIVTADSHSGCLCVVSVEIWEEEFIWNSFAADVELKMTLAMLYLAVNPNCAWIFLCISCRRDFLPILCFASFPDLTLLCSPLASQSLH